MSRSDDSGFTLIEVLVALVILIVGLSTIYRALGVGSLAGDAANRERETTAAVANLFDELGRSRSLQDGTADGLFSNGRHWTLRLAALRTTDGPDVHPRVVGYVATLVVAPLSIVGATTEYKTIVLGVP